MNNLTDDDKNSGFYESFFFDENRLSKIKTLLPEVDLAYERYAKKNHVPGYAFGVTLDGNLIHTGCAGFINIQEKIPATSKSMFRIASMTKSFTAMAILKLRDEGKLKLDNPVYSYIPEILHQKLTQDSPDITIRDLLIHSAGLPKDDPWADRQLDKTVDDLIAFLEQGISFSNVPRITYDYSNLAYTILGVIIQKVSGIPCQKYIAENIWKPLDMQQACWAFTDISLDKLVRGYRWINSNWQEEEMLSDGVFGSMGGMIASIESFSHYVAFHQAAWPPRNETETGPVKRSSLREMHQPWRFQGLNTNYQYPDGRKSTLISAYGYGLRWLQDADNRVYVGHGGGLPGFGSHWIMMPDYGIGLMLFTNITYGVAGDNIHLPILDMLIEKADLKPRYSPPSQALKNSQKVLLQLLPKWNNEQLYAFFSDNFFLDNPLQNLRNETSSHFDKVGKIIHVSGVITKNQLSGYFIMQGVKASLKISFSLTPHLYALIQMLSIESIEG